MQTSRLQYLDRGAGQGGPDRPQCKDRPYTKGDSRIYPVLSRECVGWITNKDASGVLTDTDSIAVVTWWIKHGRYSPEYEQLPRILGEVWKKLAYTGKRIEELPVLASIAVADDPGPGAPTQNFFQVIIDHIVRFLQFITDPAKWLAMLAILIGFLLLGFAIYKGLA